MFFKNRSVLVTGGAGFIGSHIVDMALKEGAERIVAFDNLVSGRRRNLRHIKENKRVKLILGDVRDADLIKFLIQDSDYIYHEAASKLVVASKRPRIDLESNIIGTFNVLEGARGTKARIIHASTGSVLGSSNLPMSEDHPPHPSTLYGINKLTAERYCHFYAREFGVNVTVLRYFHVFGPRQDYSGEAGVINIFLFRVLQGKPPIIFGTGEQIRCFTYVEDVTNANLLITRLDESIGEIYNIASKTRMSVKELAELVVEKYAKKSMKPIYGPPRPGENLKPIPDTNKIEKLGFREQTLFDNGLEITMQWVKKDMKKKSY